MDSSKAAHALAYDSGRAHCVVCNPNPVPSFHRKLKHELTLARLRSGFLTCELSTAQKEFCPACFEEWNVPQLVAEHKFAVAEKARLTRERQQRELETTPCSHCGRLYPDWLSLIHDHCACRAYRSVRRSELVAEVGGVLVGSISESV